MTWLWNTMWEQWEFSLWADFLIFKICVCTFMRVSPVALPFPQRDMVQGGKQASVSRYDTSYFHSQSCCRERSPSSSLPLLFMSLQVFSPPSPPPPPRRTLLHSICILFLGTLVSSSLLDRSSRSPFNLIAVSVPVLYIFWWVCASWRCRGTQNKVRIIL